MFTWQKEGWRTMLVNRIISGQAVLESGSLTQGFWLGIVKRIGCNVYLKGPAFGKQAPMQPTTGGPITLRLRLQAWLFAFYAGFQQFFIGVEVACG